MTILYVVHNRTKKYVHKDYSDIKNPPSTMSAFMLTENIEEAGRFKNESEAVQYGVNVLDKLTQAWAPINVVR